MNVSMDIGGMVMTKKISSTQGVTCPITTSCSKNRTLTFRSWSQASTVGRQQQTASDMVQLPMCLTLQCHWALKSDFSPGKRSFTFIVPLNVFMTTQCAEASTEGLMFSITHGRKWMPSVDCCFPTPLNICKRFPCCSLDICIHWPNSLKDILSSFEWSQS